VKRWRWQWLGLLVGGALFAWLLSRMDLAAVRSTLASLSPWQFGAVLLFYILIFGLDTWGWRFTLPSASANRVPWFSLFRVRLAGEAMNYVTPTSFVGGEPVKALLLRKWHGIEFHEGVASVVIAKTTFAVSMMLFIATGLWMTLAQPLEGAVMKLVWSVFWMLSALIGLFLLLQFLRPFHRASWAVKRFLPGWMERLESAVLQWDEAIRSFYRRSPWACLGSLGFHFLGWAAGAVEVYLILHFLGVPISFATAWSLEALWVLLRSGAFMIPGTLGASEGAVVLVCAGFGIPLAPGLALGLVRRARELTWMGLGLLEFGVGSRAPERVTG